MKNGNKRAPMKRLPALAISAVLCLALFFAASVGMVLMFELATYLPEHYILPSIGLYMLGLLVAGYYTWRWITRQFNRAIAVETDTVAD